MPIETISPELKNIVNPDQDIEELGSGYQVAEGPLWWKEDGYRAEVVRFMRVLADHGVLTGIANREEVMKAVSGALDGYVADWEISKRERYEARIAEVHKRALWPRLVALLPLMVQRRLRIIYRGLSRRLRTGTHDGSVLLESIVEAGLLPVGDMTDEFRDELLVVEQIVREFSHAR